MDAKSTIINANTKKNICFGFMIFRSYHFAKHCMSCKNPIK
jgi:hypothetical protein